MTGAKNNVPLLRFSEFSGAWEEKKFGEIISLGKEKYSPASKGADVKCVDLEHIESGSGVLLGYSKAQESKSLKTKFSNGDILYGKLRPYLRKYYRANFDGVCTTEIWVLKPRHKNGNFLAALIQARRFDDLANMSSGSKMPRAEWRTISKGIAYVPAQQEEQEKIANFISAVDERIGLLKKKKEQFEAYKCGVIQRIFSRQLRFKDSNGNEYPKWEIKKLSQVAIKSNLKNKQNKSFEVLSNSATEGIVKQIDYFDNVIADGNNTQGYYVVVKDDFVYNPRISKYAPYGPIKRSLFEVGIMSPLYTVFKFIKGNQDFWDQYFESTIWHRYMYTVANFGARFDRMNIPNDDFFNLELLYPCLDEQQKIADFLSAIDKKIELCEKQIADTEKFKKGLLQQMFV